MKNLLKKILKYRTITREDGEPYLTRYYIFRKPFKWMPSIYIHCFHSSDTDVELHGHPWGHSISFILKGSYLEEYRVGDLVKTRILSPGMFNYIPANKYHRIDLQDKEVWTLFISGAKPKYDTWYFWNRDTKEYWDWRDHNQMKSKH